MRQANDDQSFDFLEMLDFIDMFDERIPDKNGDLKKMGGDLFDLSLIIYLTFALAAVLVIIKLSFETNTAA